jgi:hypothetical protein
MLKLLALSLVAIFLVCANYSTVLFFPVVEDKRILELEKRIYQTGNVISEDIDLDLDGKKEKVTFISHFFTTWIKSEFSKTYMDLIFKKYPDSRSNEDLVMVCSIGTRKKTFLRIDAARAAYWITVRPLRVTPSSLALLLVEQADLRSGRILGVKKMVWENGHLFRRTPTLLEIAGHFLAGAFSFPPVGRN